MWVYFGMFYREWVLYKYYIIYARHWQLNIFMSNLSRTTTRRLLSLRYVKLVLQLVV